MNRFPLALRACSWPLLAALALGACSPPAQEAPAIPYYDLVARFPSADTDRETGSVRFGEPQARPWLVDGWSGEEMDRKRERPFVWSDGEVSRLRFRLLRARPLPMRFEARPYAFTDDRPPQTVEIRLNGEPVTRVELRRGVHSYQVDLPDAALVAGDNELELRYGHVRESASDEEQRRIGVAWYRIEFGAGGPPAAASEPTVSEERRFLLLPYGAQLSYLARVEPASQLRFDRLAFRGGGEAALSVWIETDGSEPREVATVAAGAEPEAIDLGVDSPTPARVVLRATARGDADEDAGVILYAPALWSSDPARVASAWHSDREPETGPRPDILIYMVDTLRADRLGCYGYDRPVSPELDEFAEHAVLFERTIGQSSWTRASIASMFTGLWPHTHGAIGRRDKLAPEASTLAESLQAAGYHTVAFATNPNIDERFGFSQGFDEYIHVRRGTDSFRLTARVLAWLDQWQGGKPLFLYLHTVDPHDPYLPPPEFAERFAPDSGEFMESLRRNRKKQYWEPTEENLRHLNALYDAEIAANDFNFGKLLDDLQERGMYDQLLTVFTSDHGEEFHDHGSFTHGKNLFGATLNVPFLIRFPGQQAARRVASPVQHADLMPTLLDYLELPIPPEVEGRSLAALADPEFVTPADADGRIYSHLELDGALTVSVVDGDWKLIEHHGRRGIRWILFNLAEDPGETRNLADDYPIRTAVMTAMLADKLSGTANQLRREEAELDEDLERSLRALGYLQ